MYLAHPDSKTGPDCATRRDPSSHSRNSSDFDKIVFDKTVCGQGRGVAPKRRYGRLADSRCSARDVSDSNHSTNREWRCCGVVALSGHLGQIGVEVPESLFYEGFRR
jgi:hypothetical protein